MKVIQSDERKLWSDNSKRRKNGCDGKEKMKREEWSDGTKLWRFKENEVTIQSDGMMEETIQSDGMKMYDLKVTERK